MPLLLPWLLLTASGADAPPPPPLPKGSFDVPAEVAILGNGMRVAVHPDPDAPEVVTWVHVGSGAAEDQPARSGVSHLVEHLLYTGSPLAPDGGYDRLLAEAGGDSNAWTDHDAMALFAWAPPAALERVLALEADRLLSLGSALDEDTVDTQLAVVSAEAALAADAPHERDLSALLASVYGAAHPYGTPVMGDPEVRATLHLAEVRAWLRRAMTPSNWTLVVAGPVEPDAVMESVAARFGGAAPSGSPSAPPTTTATDEEALPPGSDGGAPLRVFEAPVRQPTLYVAWPSPPAGHPDEAALLLLARVLARGHGGPLTAPRSSRTIGPSAWVWSGERGGLMVVEVGGPGRLGRRHRRVARQLAALGRVGVDPAILTVEKRRYLVDRARALDDLSARAERLATCVHRAGRADCLAREVDAVMGLEAADLDDAMARWMPEDGGVAVFVVPRGRRALAPRAAAPVDVP